MAAPNPELRAAILAEFRTGASHAEIARKLGITKNTVSGHISRAGLCDTHSKYNGRAPILTMQERIALLNARMDAVLQETLPILARDRARWREQEGHQRELQRLKDKARQRLWVA